MQGQLHPAIQVLIIGPHDASDFNQNLRQPARSCRPGPSGLQPGLNQTFPHAEERIRGKKGRIGVPGTTVQNVT